jgi:hypothetical protein
MSVIGCMFLGNTVINRCYNALTHARSPLFVPLFHSTSHIHTFIRCLLHTLQHNTLISHLALDTNEQLISIFLCCFVTASAINPSLILLFARSFVLFFVSLTHSLTASSTPTNRSVLLLLLLLLTLLLRRYSHMTLPHSYHSFIIATVIIIRTLTYSLRISYRSHIPTQ